MSPPGGQLLIGLKLKKGSIGKMAVLLEIKNLSVAVEGKVVLKALDLEIRPGEIVALMGPNGSGKSSLAQAIAGHPSYVITSGSVKLSGKSIKKYKPEDILKKGIFLAFQNPVSIPGLNVESYLYHIYSNLHLDKKSGVLEFNSKLLKLAGSLKLDLSLLKRYLNDGFSGGEKKRLEVLQLHLIEPKLAILDETDSGLDIDAMKLVADNIQKLAKRNKMAILVITHYQRFLKMLKPGKVIVLSKGKKISSGGANLVDKIEKYGYRSLVK